MPRKKRNTVRFSVTAPQEVKATLERLAAQNDRPLSVEAGRMLEEALRSRGLLPGVPPADGPPSR